jgi:hypothetical protein
MRCRAYLIVFPLVTFLLLPVFAKTAPMPDTARDLQIQSILISGKVAASSAGQKVTLTKGKRVGPWTLMAVISAGLQKPVAVFEDFTHQQGHMLFVDTKGVRADLPKTLEPTFAEPASLYHGHAIQEVTSSGRDLLGDEILAKGGDPEFSEVAACFPPISQMQIYTFIGTHESLDKVGFAYGGRTTNFDPGVHVPRFLDLRDQGKVWDGLVGGWLPVVRFVYPEQPGTWSEMVAYAPMRRDNDNNWIQPVWYRMSRIEKNELKWARYIDSYAPFPPRLEYAAEPFYEQLLAMRVGWEHVLDPGMSVKLPDQRLADMARHSLVRAMITRMGDEPKYGVFERAYGGNEHDGFPDTFNTDTAAMLEWGIFGLAGRYIDNYFSKYVRDDGSILYRGPETGQYGRMLTVVAEYAKYTTDYNLLLKHRHRIDAVAKLLLSLRKKALQLAPNDPAYGMIAGWSEADSWSDPDPSRYMQPYFSNSTEAARGFRDLGGVWEIIGKKTNDQRLVAWGRELLRESQALENDIQTSLQRSTLRDTEPMFLPAIAGVKEPLAAAIARDPLDPQRRSYRAFMEMLYSGNLTREQVESIFRYRGSHQGIILGIPTVYGYDSRQLAGFLSYGHAYGLLQYDLQRDFLLALYGIMAHQYTRGTWTAPETRNIDPSGSPVQGPYYWGAPSASFEPSAGPYCVPAQLVVPMMTRWMLAFEDPQSETLWLAKVTPRSWLEDNKSVSVRNSPTRWGRISFSIASTLSAHRVNAEIQLPSAFAASVKLRLRLPEGHRIQSVTVNDKPWIKFDPEEETVTLPPGMGGKIAIGADCR